MKKSYPEKNHVKTSQAIKTFLIVIISFKQQLLCKKRDSSCRLVASLTFKDKQPFTHSVTTPHIIKKSTTACIHRYISWHYYILNQSVKDDVIFKKVGLFPIQLTTHTGMGKLLV